MHANRAKETYLVPESAAALRLSSNMELSDTPRSFIVTIV